MTDRQDVPYETKPVAGRTPLGSYLLAIRSHPIVLAAVVTVTVGVILLLSRGQKYDATAHILVTPSPSGDRSLVGLPIPRVIGEPGRAVETAARLIEGAAAEALENGELDVGGETLPISAVSVEPEEGSNIVAIVATSASANRAAEIANAYAVAALEARGRELQQHVELALDAAHTQLESASDPARVEVLENRIVDLILIEGQDPTLSLAQRAATPRKAAGTPRSVTLAVGLAVGLAFGSVACLLIEALVPRRVRDELDVMRAYPLPLLARVPAPRRRGSLMAGQRQSSQTAEAFRGLRMKLSLRGGPGREKATVVAVLGGTPEDRAWEVAAGLAEAVRAHGETVVAIETNARCLPT